jgi:hypothetical protein
MDVSLSKVQPLLARPLSEGQKPRVEGWLAALKVLLELRYGVVLTVDLEPLFLVTVADAVQRRLDKTKQMIDSEAAGPFSARWNPASSLGAWFLPAELESLDSITGNTGTRTYRTPAPDHVRFVNRLESYEPESDLEEIANEAIGEPHVS